MYRFKQHFLFILLGVLPFSSVFAQLPITITLKDNLKHPSFSWPVSPVNYPVTFGPAGILEKDLTLLDAASGKNIPFQLLSPELKEGRIHKATLSFLTDLPFGANKTFTLLSGKWKAPAEGIAVVKVEKTTDAYVLNNGKIRLEIPFSQDKAAGPIRRFGNADQWLGYGEFSAALPGAKLTVTEISKGPVQAIYKLVYTFTGNKRYVVLIKLVAGMEYAELEEEISGFELLDAANWRMVWNGTTPNHRYIATRVEQVDKKQKGYDNISWEPMEGFAPRADAERHPQLAADQQNDQNGKLPFRIAPYDNWISWWRLPAAAFWSEKDNITLGIFIKDTEKWNDGKYAIWGSKADLNVYFHWKNKVLDYTFPLVNGTRSTAITAYAHQKDKDNVNEGKNPLAYVDELRRWHGWIPLDKVKNWILDYEQPETGYPKYFKPENATKNLTLPALENSLLNNLKGIAIGSERMNGPTPVGSRVYYDLTTPAFDLTASQMKAEQYRKLRAWYLFVGYLYQDEAFMPIRTMLSGHPNFLSDTKGIPGMIAFLFPNHPQSQQQADHFEKAVHLNFNYHIRPKVEAWEAEGGRWTENLATYTWAALTPAMRASYLLHHHYDGKNRILQPGVSMYGNWLLNVSTAPLKSLGYRRVYPPQGAHAHAYEDGPPNALRLLGQEMMYYNPLLAEKLFWFTKAEDSPFESTNEKNKAWIELLKGEWANNKGTNPRLTSSKFTGYGFVLRSGFGTKDEMYVNLQQIDEGPNYRWGRAAMGGNGVIYYYAQGKRYSHNGSEDVGDGPFGDTERITNFGVKKAGGYRTLGAYRSVGRNDLTEPLYDFGFAQFATVKGNKDIAADYVSRSVLQSGADYVVVYDDVTNPGTEGRFSWFTGADDDFPFIQQLLPGAVAVDSDIKPSKSSYHKDPAVMPTKGRYYDGKGSFLTVVTHKAGIKAVKTAFGCTVEKEGGLTDLVFRSSKAVLYEKDGIGFNGTAGLVQQTKAGDAGAIFAGTLLKAGGVKIELPENNQAAVAFETTAAGFNGIFQSRKAETLTFTFAKTDAVFYLDGIAQKAAAGRLQVLMPEGKHNWQWSKNGVKPQTPTITGTLVKSNAVTLQWNAVAGAVGYEVQLSTDGGITWTTMKDAVKTNSATITELTNGSKIHLRVLAKGQAENSAPSNDYPVYVTNAIPHAPEGLLLDLTTGKTKLSWGTVLGAGTYKLYRRVKSLKAKTVFTKVYEGPLTSFEDQKPAVGVIYEYAVTAVNGNGDSKFSTITDTDPTRFTNWEPKGGEGFRRDTEDHENGFLEFNPFIEDQKPVLTYPVKK